MILLVGAMLGAGVLLVLSPWLWPARPAATAPPRPRPRRALGAGPIDR